MQLEFILIAAAWFLAGILVAQVVSYFIQRRRIMLEPSVPTIPWVIVGSSSVMIGDDHYILRSYTYNKDTEESVAIFIHGPNSRTTESR